MHRSSIGARFASLLTATLLVGGMFAQATPVLAAKPGHASPFISMIHSPAAPLVSRGTINVRALLARPAAKLPFSPAAASAVLGRLEAKVRAARKAAAAKPGVGPGIIGPPVPDPVTSSGAPAAATPILMAGQTAAGSGSVEPPDPGIAVGPDTLIQSDNISFRFDDRAASGSLGSLSMPDFFVLPETFGFTTFDSDPRIHFDTLRQRWIASEVSWDCATYTFAGHTPFFGHGYLDFAISDTSDPLGSWTQAFFESDDALPDQPSFGTSTDKLAFTSNSFAMGSGGGLSNPGCASGPFQGSELRMMDWAQLVPHFISSNVDATYGIDLSVFALRVAIQEPVSVPELRLIASVNATTATDIDYLEFSGSVAHGTLTGTAFDLTTDSVVPEFLDPPNPQQPGGDLTSVIDGRPDDLIYQAGKLAFTSTYPCMPTGDSVIRDCMRIVTLSNANAALEPIRLGDTVIGTNGFDDSFGGIAWSGSGVLHAVYTRSSTSSDASSYAQYNLPTDTSIPWSAPQLLTAGAAHYAGTRWGDYTILAADPQDPNSVWVGDQYADATGKWSTTIHQIVVDAGAGYFPLAPVRVLSSRDGIGLTGVFNANVPRTLPIAGTNGIPANAVAITGNLTVTGQTAAGYLSLTPTPNANPPSSTLNFPLGDNRANNVTISLASDGSLSAVYKAAAGKHTNVILDVTGYFLVGAGQTYFPVSPVRVLSSRDGIGLTGVFHANLARAFLVGGTHGIPLDATAITANLTVTGQTKPGYVSLTPTLENNPSTSTINFPLGDNRANGLTIPINALDHKVAAVYKAASGTANVILDVTGYYSNAGGGLLFHPLNPGRRVDTRLALGVSGFNNGLAGAQGTTPRSVGVENHFGVPVGAAAITGNLTITAQTGAGYVSVTDALVAHPGTSTINFPLGDTRANGITAPLGSGDLWFVYQVVVGKHVHLILDITGYFE